MACYGGLWGILSGLTKSTDHPSIISSSEQGIWNILLSKGPNWGLYFEFGVKTKSRALRGAPGGEVEERRVFRRAEWLLLQIGVPLKNGEFRAALKGIGVDTRQA